MNLIIWDNFRTLNQLHSFIVFMEHFFLFVCSMVPSQHAEVAGTTMACCLGIGLASGAAFSFAMTAIL